MSNGNNNSTLDTSSTDESLDNSLNSSILLSEKWGSSPIFKAKRDENNNRVESGVKVKDIANQFNSRDDYADGAVVKQKFPIENSLAKIVEKMEKEEERKQNPQINNFVGENNKAAAKEEINKIKQKIADLQQKYTPHDPKKVSYNVKKITTPQPDQENVKYKDVGRTKTRITILPKALSPINESSIQEEDGRTVYEKIIDVIAKQNESGSNKQVGIENILDSMEFKYALSNEQKEFLTEKLPTIGMSEYSDQMLIETLEQIEKAEDPQEKAERLFQLKSMDNYHDVNGSYPANEQEFEDFTLNSFKNNLKQQIESCKNKVDKYNNDFADSNNDYRESSFITLANKSINTLNKVLNNIGNIKYNIGNFVQAESHLDAFNQKLQKETRKCNAKKEHNITEDLDKDTIKKIKEFNVLKEKFKEVVKITNPKDFEKEYNNKMKSVNNNVSNPGLNSNIADINNKINGKLEEFESSLNNKVKETYKILFPNKEMAEIETATKKYVTNNFDKDNLSDATKFNEMLKERLELLNEIVELKTQLHEGQNGSQDPYNLDSESQLGIDKQQIATDILKLSKDGNAAPSIKSLSQEVNNLKEQIGKIEEREKDDLRSTQCKSRAKEPESNINPADNNKSHANNLANTRKTERETRLGR